MPGSCSVCSGSIVDGGRLQCCGCRKFVHPQCANLSSIELDIIKESNSKWNCAGCDTRKRSLCSGSQSSGSDQPITMEHFSLLMSKISTMADDMKSIKRDQSSIFSELTKCRETLENHTRTLDVHQAAISECESKINILERSHAALASSVRSIVDDVCEIKRDFENNAIASTSLVSSNVGPARVDSAEILNRVKRSFNVILKNVPEPDCPDDNIHMAVDVLKNVDPNSHTFAVKATRLGKTRSSRPRLLKVTFSNSDIVTTLLRKKKNLISVPEYKHIVLCDDKTPNQIAELNMLRGQLKSRGSAGEKNLTIKYVNGSPAIVSTIQGTNTKN